VDLLGKNTGAVKQFKILFPLYYMHILLKSFSILVSSFTHIQCLVMWHISFCAILAYKWNCVLVGFYLFLAEKVSILFKYCFW